MSGEPGRRTVRSRWLVAAVIVLGALVATGMIVMGAPGVRGQVSPPAGTPSLRSIGLPITYPATVTYPMGWNLISGRAVQGLAAQQIDVPLYTYSDAGEYEPAVVDPQAPPMAGYWAYFAERTSVMLATGPDYSATVTAAPGRFILVGNPATTPVRLYGADVFYAFDAASATYQRRYALLPGEGAWAYSTSGASVVIISTPDCQTLRPPAALPINYVPPISTATPSPLPPAISCFGP